MINRSRVSRGPSRRDLMKLGMLPVSLISGRASALAQGSLAQSRTLTADEALRRLTAGNQRFVKGEPMSPRRSPADFAGQAEAQFPKALVISCSDSRVAPEILFDVGVGDIFVVRVAGNVVTGTGASVKGSIEYAVAELNVPLILVLGHTNCGAVKSAIQHINAKDSLPGSIDGLVELVKPAVVASKSMPGNALENAVRKNVEMGVDRLKVLDPILAPRVRAGTLKVVGGIYSLANGAVTILA
jgi:carbonic anhydrase